MICGCGTVIRLRRQVWRGLQELQIDTVRTFTMQPPQGPLSCKCGTPRTQQEGVLHVYPTSSNLRIETSVSPMHLHLYMNPIQNPSYFKQRKFGCCLRFYSIFFIFRFTLNTLFDPASAMFSKHSWCFLLLTCANVRDLSHAAHTTLLEDSWEAQPSAHVHYVHHNHHVHHHHHAFVKGF